MAGQSSNRLNSFTRNSLTFNVRDEGPLDGVPIVLLHGFPQDSRSWDAVGSALHDAGYRTIAPDQRGYSPGARPSRRRDYRGEELVGDVAALIETLGVGPVHLVGHDWGAAAAWQTANTHPELVRTLTAVSVPHPAAMQKAIATTRQGFRSWYMLAFQLPFLPELLLTRPWFGKRVSKVIGQSPANAERDAMNLSTWDAARGALNWYRGLPFTKGGSGRTGVPTLMVWSDRDSAIGPQGVELTEKYVRAPYRLVTFSGVSHWIPDERPAELAELIAEHAASVH